MIEGSKTQNKLKKEVYLAPDNLKDQVLRLSPSMRNRQVLILAQMASAHQL